MMKKTEVRSEVRAGTGAIRVGWPPRSMASLIPLLALAGCTGVGPAYAGVAQPGITSPVQPGITSVPLPPAVRVPEAPPDEPPAPATDYGTYRPLPRTRYAAPVRPEKLHLPQPVPDVAPIIPPPRSFRFGGWVTPAPAAVPGPVVDGVNKAAADAEAGIDTLSRSVGVRPSRSDRIAAGAIAGAVIGTLAGGATAAVVAGSVGAGVGAVVGGVVGGVVALAPMGLGSSLLLPAVATGAVIGATSGALLAAPLAAVPFAVVGGVAGGVAGAYIGATTP